MKTMKTFIRIALGLSVILAVMTSCEDNLEFSRKVRFSAAGGYQNGPKTKTAYSDKEYTEGTKTYERIDWVDGDLLKIVSDVATTATGESYADYEVVGVSGTTSRISNAEVENADDNGLNWGPGTNTFYALYPSPSTTGTGMQTGVDISTTATGATFTGVIPRNQNVTLRDTVYQPVMNYAYMWAATATTATGSVDLAFKPAMTALEFTIGNPEEELMKVTHLRLRSLNGGTALSGSFTGTINKATLACEYTCPTVASSSSPNRYIDIDFSPALEIPGGESKSVTALALPQDLTGLTVVVTLDGGETRELELKNASGTWYTFGATKKYHIGLGVPTSYDYTFTVTWRMASNYGIDAYNGANNDYTVTSYRTLRGSTVKKGVAWHAEFRERTYNTTSSQWGSWTDWSTTRPDWLYSFTDSQTGSQAGTGAKNYRAKLNAITGHNTHTDALKAKTPLGTQSSPYNLATNGGSTSETTANCYIVSAPGWYMLPLVYGNARKNGNNNTDAYNPSSLTAGTGVLKPFRKHDNSDITGPNISGTSSAGLVWQDAHNLVTNIGVYNTSYIRFYVDPEMICQGNAVIAAKNSSGTILWSWHIWVTDQTMTTHSRWGYSFMPVNLGWCDGGSITYGRREFQVRFVQDGSNITRGTFTTYQNQNGSSTTLLGNCTYYQWGRKDPMVPAKGTSDNVNDNKTVYLASGESTNTINIAKINEFTPTIGWSIQNPDRLLLADSHGTDYEYDDWLRTTHFNNLWNTKSAETGSNVTAKGKTVYDPCPPGYLVPPAGGIPKDTDTGYSLGTYNATNNWYTQSGMNWPVVGCRLLLTRVVNPSTPDVNEGGQKITGYGNYSGGYGKLLLSTPWTDITEVNILWAPPASTMTGYLNKAKLYGGNGKASASPVRCVAE